MGTFLKVVGAGVFIALAIVVTAVAIAFPVMLIVNSLFTSQVLMSVFGVAKLDFWQALMLSLLCSVLFKSSYSESKKKVKNNF